MELKHWTLLLWEIVDRLGERDRWDRNFTIEHLSGCLNHIVRSSNRPLQFRIGRVNKNWHIEGKRQVVTIFDNHGRKFELISTPKNTTKVKQV